MMTTLGCPHRGSSVGVTSRLQSNSAQKAKKKRKVVITPGMSITDKLLPSELPAAWFPYFFAVVAEVVISRLPVIAFSCIVPAIAGPEQKFTVSGVGSYPISRAN